MSAGGEIKAVAADPLAELKKLFAPFLAANPLSSIAPGDEATSGRPYIKNPWGDESLIFVIPDDPGPLADTLNPVFLPERFTAVWHADTRSIEVLFTARPFPEELEDQKTIAFDFIFHGKTIKCNFGRTSDRVLLIASAVRFVSDSVTAHRNMQSFILYQRHQAALGRGDKPPPTPVGDPVSFWIKDIDWNEEEILDLANHLNFYLSYYDRTMPEIVIHSPALKGEFTPSPRFRIGHFPKTIIVREIDDNLNHFWLAARAGDPARRFLYCYRAIEYASVFYLDAETKATVRRLLAAPHSLSGLDEATEKIIQAIQETKTNEVAKFEGVMRNAVTPEILWKEMQLNEEAFCNETVFDGGFVLPPLYKKGIELKHFAPQAISTVAGTFRNIRNALSHGKDQRTMSVVAPTSLNFVRLRPWVSLINAAAAEVILYKDLT